MIEMQEETFNPDRLPLGIKDEEWKSLRIIARKSGVIDSKSFNDLLIEVSRLV